MAWTLLAIAFLPDLPVLAAGIGGATVILGGALALGIRHGIDWDHIAAITDITSTSATIEEPDPRLTVEPGLQLTDESHHRLAQAHADQRDAPVAVRPSAPPGPSGRAHFWTEQRRALMMGTLYALGHGSVVVMLGLIAIIASEVLPDWVDPLMEQAVGITLLFLAAYLFYSLYQYFRGGKEFRIRSRWMLVFAAVGNLWHRLVERFGGRHEHHRIDANQQYGARTSFGIGMIHGIGAETGTQALIIATAVGAGSKTMSVLTLFVFVCGILISNSIIVIASATGFVSARRQQRIYVAAGVLAAVFSLVIGLVFITRSTDLLPNLDPYFRWIGGPSGQ